MSTLHKHVYKTVRYRFKQRLCNKFKGHRHVTRPTGIPTCANITYLQNLQDGSEIYHIVLKKVHWGDGKIALYWIWQSPNRSLTVDVGVELISFKICVISLLSNCPAFSELSYWNLGAKRSKLETLE